MIKGSRKYQRWIDHVTNSDTTQKWWFCTVIQQIVWNQIYMTEHHQFTNPGKILMKDFSNFFVYFSPITSSNLYNGGYDVILFSSLFYVLTNTTVYWCTAEFSSCCAVIPLWFIPPFFSWGWRQRGRGEGEPLSLTETLTRWPDIVHYCDVLNPWKCSQQQVWGGEAAATPAAEARQFEDAAKTCVSMNSALLFSPNKRTSNFITDVMNTGATH